jgi:uncharacterized surface protein with fasciclin (FAS1) repeats/plastocyanin
MKNLLTIALAFCLSTLFGITQAQAQCEADVTVYLTDFVFTPNALTISVGQTVAFVNAEGVHNVDGTAEDNPVSFFLEQSEGNIEGLCMGTFTFDIPGTYNFTSSVGVQPELGMNGMVVVDAVTIADELYNLNDAGTSGYAFNTYLSSTFNNGLQEFPNESWAGDVDLNGLDNYTVFVPNNDAVDELMELMNLGSFDMLGFYDMAPALKYHVVPGIYMANDLEDGMALPTAEGQSVTISIGESGAMVDDATIVETDITAFNGVIHIVDQILAPQGYPSATTWDVIVQSPAHTILEQALLNEGLEEALRGQPILNDNEAAEGPFTVFAPTDDAFYAFAEANGFANEQELLNSQFIDDILDGLLVEAVYESGDLFNGQLLLSYGSEGITIGVDEEGISVNTAPIVQADMLAYNGVVHSLGELMPFDFPEPEGTCGAWTITMTCGFGGPDGWEGSSLHVFADGNEVASETMLSVGSESFFIPVDIGNRIDVVYNDVGWGQYHDYSITDNDGNVVFSSNEWGVPGDDPCNVYGLNPCDEDPTCGLIEITFTDDSGDGWYFGNLEVYSESGLEANIFFNPDFDGDGYADYIGFSTRTAVVTVDEGEVDFVVSAPIIYPTQCGYTVKNPEGDIVIEETNTTEVPPSNYDVEICASNTSNSDELTSLAPAIAVFPNPVASLLSIKGIATGEKWQAAIFNAEGKMVHHEECMGSEAIDVTRLRAGLYTLKLDAFGGSSKSARFVKE